MCKCPGFWEVFNQFSNMGFMYSKFCLLIFANKLYKELQAHAWTNEIYIYICTYNIDVENIREQYKTLIYTRGKNLQSLPFHQS